MNVRISVCFLASLALVACNVNETYEDVDTLSSSSSVPASSSSLAPDEGALPQSSSSTDFSSSSIFTWWSSSSGPASSSSLNEVSSSSAGAEIGLVSGATIGGRKLVKGNFSLPDLLWDSTEVTQGEFFALLNERPWTASIVQLGNLGNLTGEQHPAVMNYFQAVRLANARSVAENLEPAYAWTGVEGWKLLGLTRNASANGYRLPSEDEWEHAYNASMEYGFYWNSKSWVNNEYPLNDADYEEIGRYAVYDKNSRLLGKESGKYGWHAVATKLPNAYGLYDMAGNVSEFVENAGDIYAYSANIHAKGGDWGSPYMGLTDASSSGTIIGEEAFWGLRLVRPL